MTPFRKIVTIGFVAVAMLAGRTAPAATQVKGGETECDYELVLDDWIIVGTQFIPFWHIEETCVTILDDA